MKRCVDLEKVGYRFMQKSGRGTLRDMLDVYRACMRISKICGTLQEMQPGDDQLRAAVAEKFLTPLKKVHNDMEKFRALVEELVDVERLNTYGLGSIRVKSSFSELLATLDAQLDEMKMTMEEQRTSVARQIGMDEERVKLERTIVHGYFLRVTKRDQNQLRKLPDCVTISVQKAGVLFGTRKLKATSERFERVLKQYQNAQREIEQQALTLPGRILE
jgi:hypothetical protein